MKWCDTCDIRLTRMLRSFEGKPIRLTFLACQEGQEENDIGCLEEFSQYLRQAIKEEQPQTWEGDE